MSVQRPVLSRATLQILAFVILAVSILLTWATYDYSKKNNELYRAHEFEQDVERAYIAVRERLTRYADILYGAKGLFEASHSVERAEWRDYLQYRSESGRFDQVWAVGYVEYVSAGQKDAFVDSVRKDTSVDPNGLPLFTIHPESASTDYYPVKYVQTRAERQAILGRDFGLDAARKVAMERARDEDSLSMTGWTHVIADPENLPSVLFFLPIYRRGMPHGTVDERRSTIQGFVFLSIRVADFFKDIIRDERLSSTMDMDIYDGLSSDSELLYDSDPSVSAVDEAKRALKKTLSLEMGGRMWTLRFSVIPEGTSGKKLFDEPRVVALVGSALSLLIFITLQLLLHARVRAEKMASEMTRDIQDSHRLYSEMIANAPDPIVTLDKMGRLTAANKAAERLTGLVASQHLGKIFTEIGLIPMASIPQLVKTFALNISGNLQPPVELDIVRKDGVKIRVEANTSIMRRGGAIVGVQSILRDITERKRVEDRLRLLSIIAEQSPASIIVTDVHGDIQYVNAKFEQVSGYSREECIGKNPRILKSGEMSIERYKELWRTIAGGKEWRGEFHNKKKDGSLFWESASIAPIRGADGKIMSYLGVKEDITERKKVEARLMQAEKMESIGQLAGGIAHDLNNGLTPVIGYLDLLRRQSLDKETLELLSEAKLSAQRCADLVNSLLRFSRPSSRQKIALDTQSLLVEFIKMARSWVPASITLEMTCPDAIWPVIGNETDLQTVLMNLASNARDAMPHGGILKVSAKNCYFSEMDAHAGDFVGFEISDTGHGIPADELKKIYDPFFTTKAKGKGTGLGLATVFSIVKEHGGWLDVSSQVGRGTSFHFFIPRSAAVFMPEDDVVEPALPTGKETVLFVDDEERVRRLAEVFLKRLGYHGLFAADGEEALRLFQADPKKIDLVVLDMTMPGLSGVETLKRLIKTDPKVRVVLISGFTEEGAPEELIRQGACAFLSKPFNVMVFAQTVRKALEPGA